MKRFHKGTIFKVIKLPPASYVQGTSPRTWRRGLSSSSLAQKSSICGRAAEDTKYAVGCGLWAVNCELRAVRCELREGSELPLSPNAAPSHGSSFIR